MPHKSLLRPLRRAVDRKIDHAKKEPDTRRGSEIAFESEADFVLQQIVRAVHPRGESRKPPDIGDDRKSARTDQNPDLSAQMSSEAGARSARARLATGVCWLVSAMVSICLILDAFRSREREGRIIGFGRGVKLRSTQREVAIDRAFDRDLGQPEAIAFEDREAALYCLVTGHATERAS